MSHSSNRRGSDRHRSTGRSFRDAVRGRGGRSAVRPAAAYRRRGAVLKNSGENFTAPEVWHEPTERAAIRYLKRKPGTGYVHPVTIAQIRERLAELPERFVQNIDTVQLSPMTRKRRLFPLYGMQWGPNIYLYPIEKSLEEYYLRPPQPAQQIEAKMFGGHWSQEGGLWKLTWTPETIADFYLNNVLIHEVGHVNDVRNTNFDARERYANWFAIEYGYRRSRRRA